MVEHRVAAWTGPAVGHHVLLETSGEASLDARWDLDGPGLDARPVPRGEEAVASACSLAGRNPTSEEWTTYFSQTAAYVEVCPSFTTAEEQEPKEQ